MKKLIISLAGFAVLNTAAITAAHAELVVIVNPKHPAASLSAEQVANIYLGKDPTWAPLDLPESAAARDDFYQKVAGKEAAQVKAIWSRLIFTGKVQPPKVMGSGGEAAKHVASNEKAIAYVDKSEVDASVKAVLTLN